MFLRLPPDDEATARLYQGDLDSDGFVMNLSRMWAWRTDLSEAFTGLRALLASSSGLSGRERAVIVCATVGTMGDAYCSLAWGTKLAGAADPATAAAVLQAVESDGLTARERALAAWARKVAREPNGTAQEDVDQLRAAGLSEREIFEATALVAFRVAFSTINAALGTRPDWQLAAAAPPEIRGAVTYGRPAASNR